MEMSSYLTCQQVFMHQVHIRYACSGIEICSCGHYCVQVRLVLHWDPKCLQPEQIQHRFRSCFQQHWDLNVEASILHFCLDSLHLIVIQNCFSHQNVVRVIPGTDPSIAFLELLGIAIAFVAWGKEFSGRRIAIQSDNQSAVHTVNNLTSRCCSRCMEIVRILTLHSLQFNVKLTAIYLPGKQNLVADALSRLNMKEFLLPVLGAEVEPDPIPYSLWQCCVNSLSS